MIKRFSSFVLAFLMCLNTGIPSYATEIKSKESNWVKYTEGQFFKTLPEIAPYMTGFYTTATNNQLDYKQDEETFKKQINQFPVKGYSESFYESNQTIPISYASNAIGTGQVVSGVQKKTGISAYDSYIPEVNLKFDIANGQWLLNNKYFSRFNDKISTNNNNGNIVVSELNQAPWGVENSLTNASRDEFLVALSKIAYGSIESRPIFFEVPAYRYAKKVEWIKVYDDEGNLIGYTYHEESAKESSTSDRVANNEFLYQRVSNPQTYNNKSSVFRGEFITKPEESENRVYYQYTSDYWSYVTTNVWELYILKLLSMGILDYNEVFNIEGIRNGTVQSNVNLGPKGDTYEFNTDIAHKLAQEYNNYGKTIEGQKTTYPAYAPELGIVVANSSNRNNSLRNIDYKEVNGSEVLGSNYKVESSAITFLSDGINNNKNQNQSGLPAKKYSTNQSITNIAALRLIERVLRVEEKNMSALEASIIAQKYGAKYLDNIPEIDRKTVEYLIALGIIDFENYDEYANLYNVLSREFCYTLLYRVANKNARTDFSKLLLTDASSASLGLPSNYSNYQNTILTNDSSSLDKYISKDGRLVHNGLDENSKELSLVSSIYIEDTYPSGDGNSVYHALINIDDPMKYLYRGLPLVATTHMYDMNNSNGSNTGVVSPDNSIAKMIPVNIDPWGRSYKGQEYYIVYPENSIGSRDARVMKELSKFNENSSNSIDNNNFLNPNSPLQVNDPRWLDNSDNTGIISVRKIKDSNRYLVDISIATVDDLSTATFVKANMINRTKGLLQSNNLDSIVSDNSNTLMVSADNSTISSNIKTDNNIVNGSTIVNSSVGLSNNKIVSGDISKTVNEKVMVSDAVVKQANTNIVSDTLGDKPTIALNSNILNKPNVKVISKNVNDVSKMLVRDFNVVKGKDFNITDKYYDITQADIGSIITKDILFEWENPDKNGAKDTAEGTIIIELILELPNSEEQNALVGSNIQKNLLDSDLKNWIYTEPTSPDLLTYWNYNKCIVNAILKTIGSEGMEIKSGYLYPKITILIDKAPKSNGSSGINQNNLNIITDKFLKDIGKNIDGEWISKYIGSSYIFNLRTSDLDKVEVEKLKASGLISSQDNKTLYLENPPSNGILKTEIGKNLPVWAEIYFNNATPANTQKTNMIHPRLKLPSFNIYPIFEFSGTNTVYGSKYEGIQVGDVGDRKYDLPFIKSDLNHIFMSMNNSNYSYDVTTNLIISNNVSSSFKNMSNKLIKYGDTEWIVVGETDTEIQLVANSYIRGVLENGTVIDPKSKMDILKSSEAYVHSIFGKGIDTSIDEKQTYNFKIFDTSLIVESKNLDKKFLEINNDIMQVYKYNTHGTTQIKEKVTADNGESVLFRPYVTLNKSTWNYSKDAKNIEWSKRFLGADYKYYSPYNNILLMKADILPKDSKNRIKYSEVKQAVFTIGTISGQKSEDGLILMLPFKNTFVDSQNKINESELISTLSEYGTAIQTPDNQFYTSTDYALNSRVATYNKNKKDYDKTLVQNNGKLYVADRGKISSYNASIKVKNVAVSMDLDDNLSVIISETITGELIQATLDAHQTTSPPIKEVKEEIVLATSNLPEGVSFAGEKVEYKGVDNALVYFNNLIDFTNTMRTRTMLSKMVWFILFLSVSYSIFIVIARTMRIIPLIHKIFYDFWESSGIDLYVWMSLTLINVEEEPLGWIKTIMYSFLLALIPTLIVALMEGFGIQFI